MQLDGVISITTGNYGRKARGNDGRELIIRKWYLSGLNQVSAEFSELSDFEHLVKSMV